jgi:hypothetical protein
MLKRISNPMCDTRRAGSSVFASPVLRGSRPEVSP